MTADFAFASGLHDSVHHNPTLTVNGSGASYTTERVDVDVIAGVAVSYSVVFKPNAANVDPTTVQIYTNLNRRDYAMLPYTAGNRLATQ